MRGLPSRGLNTGMQKGNNKERGPSTQRQILPRIASYFSFVLYIVFCSSDPSQDVS